MNPAIQSMLIRNIILANKARELASGDIVSGEKINENITLIEATEKMWNIIPMLLIITGIIFLCTVAFNILIKGMIKK